MNIEFWYSSYDGRHGKPRASDPQADKPLQLRRFPMRHWANVPGVHYPKNADDFAQKTADEKALLETNERVYVNEPPDLEKWMPAVEAVRDFGISRQRMGRMPCPRVMYRGRLFLHRETLLESIKDFSLLDSIPADECASSTVWGEYAKPTAQAILRAVPSRKVIIHGRRVILLRRADIVNFLNSQNTENAKQNN